MRELLRENPYPSTDRYVTEIQASIGDVVWPPGSTDFAIYPESGKKRGQGSGVGAIRECFTAALRRRGWETEVRISAVAKYDGGRPGPVDGAKASDTEPPFVVEWETGNIASSHRAINKMAIGIMRGELSGGMLALPTGALAQYLTDRIGNFPEIEPYFPLWRSLSIERGYLAVLAFEHDREDITVPRLPKRTDGRALG